MSNDEWLKVYIQDMDRRIDKRLVDLEKDMKKLVLKDAKIAGGIIVASAIVTIAFQLIQLIYKNN